MLLKEAQVFQLNNGPFQTAVTGWLPGGSQQPHWKASTPQWRQHSCIHLGVSCNFFSFRNVILKMIMATMLLGSPISQFMW